MLNYAKQSSFSYRAEEGKIMSQPLNKSEKKEEPVEIKDCDGSSTDGTSIFGAR